MSPKFILLVEDDPDDEALTMRSLRKHKIMNPVKVVNDGEAALEYLIGSVSKNIEPQPLPQLVLLDLKLPKVDGLEVLKVLRSNQRTQLLPIVIFTSSNEQLDVITSYKNGANSFIRKPVDFEEFTDAIGKLGMYWLLLNHDAHSAGEI